MGLFSRTPTKRKAPAMDLDLPAMTVYGADAFRRLCQQELEVRGVTTRVEPTALRDFHGHVYDLVPLSERLGALAPTEWKTLIDTHFETAVPVLVLPSLGVVLPAPDEPTTPAESAD